MTQSADPSVLLLTCAGAPMMPILAGELRREDGARHLIGGDADARALARSRRSFDAVSTLPWPNEPAYLDALFELCSRHKIGMAVFGSDEEARVAAQNANALRDQGIRCPVPDRNVIAVISDKLRVAITLAKSKLAVPDSFPFDPESEHGPQLERAGFPDRPVVIKPRTGRGRRGVLIVSETTGAAHDDIPNTVRPVDLPTQLGAAQSPMLVSAFIAGIAWTVDVLAHRGTLLQAVCREWLAPWRFPFPGQRVSPNDAILSYVGQVTEILELDGLLDIDLIVDASGKPWLLEVNPRPSGSMFAALVAGVPLITMATDLANGRAHESAPHPDGVIVRVVDGNVVRDTATTAPA